MSAVIAAENQEPLRCKCAFRPKSYVQEITSGTHWVKLLQHSSAPTTRQVSLCADLQLFIHVLNGVTLTHYGRKHARNCQYTRKRHCLQRGCNDSPRMLTRAFSIQKNQTPRLQQHCLYQDILGTFSQPQKEPVSFAMSVHPSVRPFVLLSTYISAARTGEIFREIWYWKSFMKICRIAPSMIKILKMSGILHENLVKFNYCRLN